MALKPIPILTVAFALIACMSCGAATNPPEHVADSTPSHCPRTEGWSGEIAVGQGGNPPGPALAPPDGLGVTSESAPPTPAELQTVSISPMGESAPGVERIVYQFAGDGQLGWSVRFVDVPLRYGDTQRVPVAGKCVLQVDFTGFPWGEGEPHYAPRVTSAEASEVVEVLTLPPREGVTQSFTGLRSQDAHVAVDQDSSRAQLSIILSS
ncbi:AMIN-like domain-containing (lipo)protein [Rhodococcus olei]|uniref:AMIN-like domain-containing (lipo)protein n=1 Tax=Rhodococcus olei TaxID=2161675 RepID=UPI003CD08EC0